MSEKATPQQLLASIARWTAAVRAREGLREDRLFQDPWAGLIQFYLLPCLICHVTGWSQHARKNHAEKRKHQE